MKLLKQENFMYKTSNGLIDMVGNNVEENKQFSKENRNVIDPFCKKKIKYYNFFLAISFATPRTLGIGYNIPLP